MIVTTKIKTRWSPSNKKYYENIGYPFTQYGKELLVDIEDVPKRSHAIIEYTCDNCGELCSSTFDHYTKKKHNDLCQACVNRLESGLRLYENAKTLLEKADKICAQKGYVLLTTPDTFDHNTFYISYICPSHGIQSVYIYNLFKGCECIRCAATKRNEQNRYTQDEVKSIIESVNGNTWLNYGEYVGAHICNLKIQCKCGEIFTTCLINYRDRDVQRCSRCSGLESKGERYIREFLSSIEEEFEQEYIFNDCKDVLCLPFDFYLRKRNLIIEFDGMQHFFPIFGEEIFKITKKHDDIKTKYCEDNQIHLLRIPYWEFQNCKTIISEKLKEIGKEIV